MIAIFKKMSVEKPIKKEDAEKDIIKDIIVKRVSYKQEEQNNVTTITRQIKTFNVTKKVNETAKALRIATAMEKVEELNKQLLNKGVY